MRAKIIEMNAKRYHDGGSVHPHPHDASLPRLKKKIFESFPKKKYPTRNPGGMGIDKSTPPLIGSGASAYFGGLLGGGGGMMVGYHEGGYVHPHPHDALTNTLIQAPPKGTTAYAKYAYEMAKHYGGAAKTAAKLTKPIKVSDGPAYSWLGSDGTIGYSRHDKYKYVDAGMGSAKQVESQILSDLSKTAMRAKIIEMNAKRYSDGGVVGGAPHSLGMSSMGKTEPKKQNWFQRYVSGLTETSDSLPAWARDPLGVHALLRKIAGQSRKGDNLSAALLPFNFMGVGLGARAGIGSAGIANSARLANASTGAGGEMVSSMRSSKASKTILRNLQKKAMEFAEARGATLPEMTLSGDDAFTNAPTSFFSPPGTDLSKAYNYYWGQAWEILNKNGDPAVKDVSKEYFMTMLGLMGKGQISRDVAAETLPTDFSRAANMAYAMAHGLDPKQPLAMFKAAPAHTKLGGYWSLSSKMASHYASQQHLNLAGDQSGRFSNAGLYKIDVLPEQVPTPLSIGGMYDEFTATLPPSLVETIGGAERIALEGKTFVVRDGFRGIPGPQRSNTADEFYSVVRGAPLPPGMNPWDLASLMKTDLFGRLLPYTQTYNDVFKKLLDFGTIVRKFHTGGLVGHKHNNPNIGKIITGPNGGQFDFTQVTYSPATKYPTSGPNAFINESTGQAMQPMSKEEYKAYQKERLEYNKAYKISHAAKIEEYIKTLDNRPSRTILAERLGHGEINMGGNALGRLGVPMFENGINMVPANMLAMLHKDEAVIPANMNPFNPNASAAVSGSVYNINVELNGTTVTAKDVALEIRNEMRIKEMAAGVNRRVGNG